MGEIQKSDGLFEPLFGGPFSTTELLCTSDQNCQSDDVFAVPCLRPTRLQILGDALRSIGDFLKPIRLWYTFDGINVNFEVTLMVENSVESV